MDMDPMTIKGVWGFNGTERPGAVYLASVLATHAQKGLPAFGIYGHEVQDRDQVTEIPDDVKEKLLRFGRAAVAAATMRGKSYLQIGSVTMGIGGSIMDQDFMEEYLGLRVESVDEVEILRRMEEGIYDHEAYEKALAWTKEHCREGRDDNPEYVDFLGEKRRIKFTPEEKEKQWEFTIKMYLHHQGPDPGQSRTCPQGFEEEKVGHNAIAAGFQGQRQWTDHWPNCDYPEAVLNSSFDFEGPKEPMVFATENDVLNGLGMLFMELLTNRAQIFADVRTYWSPEATKRVTGYDLEGKAKENGGIIHLLNSGAACLDACGECTDEDGNAVMKRWWEVDDADIQKHDRRDRLVRGRLRQLPRRRLLQPLCHPRGNARDHDPPEPGQGPRPRAADRRGLDGRSCPTKSPTRSWSARTPRGPCTWFTPRCDGKAGSPFESAYSVMQNWGANHGAISYGHVGADLITLCSMLRIPVCMHNVADKDVFRPAAWNAFGMDKEGAGLPRLRRLRPDVQEHPLNRQNKKGGQMPAFFQADCAKSSLHFRWDIVQ